MRCDKKSATKYVCFNHSRWPRILN